MNFRRLSWWLPRLEGVVKRSETEYIALCPAHDDSKPSLSLTDKGDGSALAYCFAGCTYVSIVSALEDPDYKVKHEQNRESAAHSHFRVRPDSPIGSSRSTSSKDTSEENDSGIDISQINNLFKNASKNGSKSGNHGSESSNGESNHKEGGGADDSHSDFTGTALGWWENYTGVPGEEWEKWGVVNTRDELGFTWSASTIKKIRKIHTKEFRWQPVGSVVPPLWPAPQLVAAETVVIAEGESDAGILRYLGYDAYAITKGAKATPPPSLWAALAARGTKNAIVMFDGDEAGQLGATSLAQSAEAGGLKTTIIDIAGSGLLNPFTGEKDIRDIWVRTKDVSHMKELVQSLISGAAEGGVKSLPLRPIEEVAKETDTMEETAETLVSGVKRPGGWIWGSYIARGAISMLAGSPKIGKSSLLFSLLHVMKDGGIFFDTKVELGKAIILTEERHETIKEKVKLYGPLPHVDILMRSDIVSRGKPWQEVVTNLVTYCSRNVADMIIIDTFPEWADIKEENSSGEMLEKLRPLQLLTDKGIAVMIVVHHRKTAGDHGSQVRGSSALYGFTDTLLEIKLDQQGNRILSLESRFQKLPDPAIVGRDDAGHVMKIEKKKATPSNSAKSSPKSQSQGTKSQSSKSQTSSPPPKSPQPHPKVENAVYPTGVMGQICEFCNNGIPMDLDSLLTLTEMPVKQLETLLERAVQRGSLRRTGTGKEGAPYLWQFVSNNGFATANDEEGAMGSNILKWHEKEEKQK